MPTIGNAIQNPLVSSDESLDVIIVAEKFGFICKQSGAAMHTKKIVAFRALHHYHDVICCV